MKSFSRFCLFAVPSLFIAFLCCSQLAWAQNDNALGQLRIQTDFRIQQPTADADFVFMVRVIAVDSAGDSANPQGLILNVSSIDNSLPRQSTYSLFFSKGVATATVSVSLVEQGRDGSVELFVRDGFVSFRATVDLLALEILSTIVLTRPGIVLQPATGSSVQISVSVTGIGSKGNLLNPQGLVLEVAAGGNTSVAMTTYALTFSGGTAQTTVTAELIAQLTDGSVRLSVSAFPLIATATVVLQAVKFLGALSVTAPDVIEQTVSGQKIVFAAVVTATDTLGNPYGPQNLQFLVSGTNASVAPMLSELVFTDGRAQINIAVTLQIQGMDGELQWTVSGGMNNSVLSSATVAVNAQPLLGALTISAPASTEQTQANTPLVFTVVVTATSTVGEPLNLSGYRLNITEADNSLPVQSSYPLQFSGGRAEPIVEVLLRNNDRNGSIILSVVDAAGVVSARQRVQLLPFSGRGRIVLSVVSTQVYFIGSREMFYAMEVEARLELIDPASLGAITLQPTATPAVDTIRGLTNFNFLRDGVYYSTAVVTVQTMLGLFDHFIGIRGGFPMTTLSFDASGQPSTAVIAGTTTSFTVQPELFAVFFMSVPANVGQSSIGAPLHFSITPSFIADIDSYPSHHSGGEVLTVRPIRNVRVEQNSYPIVYLFFSGTNLSQFPHFGSIRINMELINQEQDGEIELGVSGALGEGFSALGSRVTNGGGIGNFPFRVRLAAVRRVLEIMPDTVLQSTVGSSLQIPLTVSIQLSNGGSINPTDLELRVTALENTEISQSTYALTFVEGVTQFTVAAALSTQGFDGGLFLEVTESDGSVFPTSATITLRAVQILNRFRIDVSDRVIQDMTGADLAITVRVEALDRQGRGQEDLQGVSLEALAGDNTTLTAVSYALDFAGGVAQTTVTVRLLEQGRNGSMELVVSSGTVSDRAAVELRAVELLTALGISAPVSVAQLVTDEALEIAVVVTATGTFGAAFDPQGLVLQVLAASNSSLVTSSYALDFSGGVAQTTVTVRLLEQGRDGSVLLSVAGNGAGATATVSLRAVELLTALGISAPVSVAQSVTDEALEIAVVVTATDTFGDAFDPQGLVLQVLAASNSILATSSHALDFAGGVAQTTVTVRLAEQGRNGSVLLSVAGNGAGATATVLLRAVELLGVLGISAPVSVAQPVTDAALEIAVVVTATGTLGNAFEPQGLVLQVLAVSNSILVTSSHALDFAGGVAQTTVTVRLAEQGRNGSVLLSVAGAGAGATAPVSLRAVELLGVLGISAPVSVAQPVTGEALEIAVVVTATGTLGNAFEPQGLVLQVLAASNSSLVTSSYALDFSGGVAQTTVTVRLLEQGRNGSVLLSVAGAGAGATAPVSLRAVELLASLSIGVLPDASLPVGGESPIIDVPLTVAQPETGESIELEVVVMAAGTLGNPFEPGGLELVVVAIENALLMQTRYALTFTAGVATVTVSVELMEQGFDGEIQLSIASGDIASSATVSLRAVELLSALGISAPVAVAQPVTGAALEIAVVVTATGTLGNAIDPGGLELVVVAIENALLTQTSYALTFTAGVATVTVSVELMEQGFDGEIQLSIASGDIASSATVSLRAVELLTALGISAPVSVAQPVTGEALEIVVVVTATGTLGNAIDPQGLVLQVLAASNSSLATSSHALDFAGGVAQTTVTVSLLEQGRHGSVLLSVVGAGFAATATVSLRAVELLEVLGISAPVSVAQPVTDEALKIVVVVTATGTLGNAFEPQGLVLQVLAASNSRIETSSHALDFAAGVAQTTVTVRLAEQGRNGSVQLLVASGSIGDNATVALIAAAVVEPQVLAALTIDAPASVNQLAVAAELEIVVVVTAIDTLGNAFEPQGLSLEVMAGSNTTVTQSTYELIFTAGEVQVTVLADLIDQESNGELLLRVMGQSETVVHRPVRVELLRALLTGAELTLDTPDLIQQRIGEAVETTLTITVFGNGRQVFPLSGLSLTYSAIPELAAISLSTQQLLFQAPQSGVVSSVTVRVSVLPAPAQNSTVSFSLAGFVLGAVDVSPAILRVTAVPRRLAVVSLSLADPVVRQLVADEAVAVTLTVVARDNYQQPIAVATVALTATATSGAIVNIPQISVGESGVAAVGVEVTLSDHRDTRVTIQLRRGDLDESVNLLPEAGVVAVIEAVPVLRNVVLELLTAAGDLRQIDPRLPVQFEVRISALDQSGRAIDIERLELQVEVDPSSARFTLDSEVAGFTAAGALVRVFVLPVQVMDTTVTLQATDLDTNIASTRLSVRVQADTRAPIEPLDLTGDGVASAVDLIVADRWLYYNRPADITAALVINLPLRITQITTESYTNMKELLAVDSDRGDINNDGQVDQFDVRSMLHYLSGLPVSRLDGRVDVNLLRLLLGQEVQLPAGLRAASTQ